MKIILLSGGSGKRLWPLSNNQRSKQFIRILKNGLIEESMVERVWRQIKSLNLEDSVYIATGYEQKNILKNQLDIKEDKIITEPFRRDTFPAISLACTYLYSNQKVDPNEIIFVLPVDPFVETIFFEKLFDLEKLIVEKNLKLGLIGVNPIIPSEKYGYIVPERESKYKVKYFEEKPKKEVALKLIKDKALWNAGVFGFKLNTILKLLKERGYSLDYETLIHDYNKLPPVSFDYEFTEKQNSIGFVKYNGFWKDLGTWNTLTEEMGDTKFGYKSDFLDSTNSHIINETDLPIAAIGVHNLIIAAGPEGILVSNKEDSPRVKELDANFFSSINYTEEEWGIKKRLYNNGNSAIFLCEMFSNKKMKLKLEKNERIIKISGDGSITKMDNEVDIISIEDFTYIVIKELD